MEIRNNRIIIVIAIIIAVFIFLRIVPLFKSESEKLRDIILSAKAATEEEDIQKCMSFISAEYKDKDDNNKASLFLIGKNVFSNYNDILIIIENLKISVISNKEAKAHILAFGQGKRDTGKFDYILDTQRVEFEVFFKKEGSKWKVVELNFIEPQDFMQLLKLLQENSNPILIRHITLVDRRIGNF